MITEKDVENAYKAGAISLKPDPNCETGTVFCIGDEWYYFGGEKAAELNPSEYVRMVAEEEIIYEIFVAIDELKMESPDDIEYERCEEAFARIKENIGKKEIPEKITKRELTALRKFGIKATEYSDGNIKLVVQKNKSGTTATLTFIHPDEFCPSAVVSSNLRLVRYPFLQAFSREESEIINRHAGEIWDFLSLQEIKDVLDGMGNDSSFNDNIGEGKQR